MLVGKAEADRLVLADWVAIVDRCARCSRREVRRRRSKLCDIAVVDRNRTTDAVNRAVRVSMRKTVQLRVAARIELQRYAIAGTQEVRMHDAAVQQQLLRFGISNAARELPGHPVIEIEVYIDKIRTTRHRYVLHLDVFDIRQALQTYFGTVNQQI